MKQMESVVGDTGSEPKWVRWSRQLMAIAQNGLTYAENHFDAERYGQIRVVAAEMMAEQSEMDDRKVTENLPDGVNNALLLARIGKTVGKIVEDSQTIDQLCQRQKSGIFQTFEPPANC